MKENNQKEKWVGLYGDDQSIYSRRRRSTNSDGLSSSDLCTDIDYIGRSGAWIDTKHGLEIGDNPIDLQKIEAGAKHACSSVGFLSRLAKRLSIAYWVCAYADAENITYAMKVSPRIGGESHGISVVERAAFRGQIGVDFSVLKLENRLFIEYSHDDRWEPVIERIIMTSPKPPQDRDYAALDYAKRLSTLTGAPLIWDVEDTASETMHYYFVPTDGSARHHLGDIGPRDHFAATMREIRREADKWS